MHIVQLTALRPLRGDYGTLDKPMDLQPRNVEEGQHFTTDNYNAESLEANGLAERYRPPAPAEFDWKQYLPPERPMMNPPENKMVQPEENKAAAAAIEDARAGRAALLASQQSKLPLRRR